MDELAVVSKDGTTLRLTRASSGPRTVLCVSGGPTTGARWSGVARLLDGRAECRLMDRRGRGRSGDTEPYAFERECEDVAAAAEALGPDVRVAGHSSGTVCALGAVLAGATVGSLVLYEPPWPVGDTPVPRETRARIEAGIASGERDDALAIALHEVVGLPAPAIAAVRGTPIWAEWTTWLHTWPREIAAIDTLPPAAGLRRPSVPTLLLLGESTVGGLRRSAETLAGALDAPVIILPGQGHGALDLAPQLVAEAIDSGL